MAMRIRGLAGPSARMDGSEQSPPAPSHPRLSTSKDVRMLSHNLVSTSLDANSTPLVLYKHHLKCSTFG